GASGDWNVVRGDLELSEVVKEIRVAPSERENDRQQRKLHCGPCLRFLPDDPAWVVYLTRRRLVQRLEPLPIEDFKVTLRIEALANRVPRLLLVRVALFATAQAKATVTFHDIIARRIVR